MKKIILILSLALLSTSNKSTNIQLCDIKGFVNKPGVYEISENYTIQDVINMAGGLKKDAYTNNINLSKKVKDEMVIYIHSKNEIERIEKLNSCVCTPTYKYIECEESNTKPIETTTSIITTSKLTQPIKTTQNITTTKPIENKTTTTIKLTEPITQTTTQLLQTKININNCNIEDLTKLKGLGEIKAKKIIDYRELNGQFKSIEELLNIDGIGETTFAKIKDYIEI